MAADNTPAPTDRLGASALKAFTHPLRMALLSALQEGPATATMLARRLGESSGQTSYHLRQLERHGLVEDDPAHVGGRERWWRAVGFTVDGGAMLADPATTTQAQALVRSVVADQARTLGEWAARLGTDHGRRGQAAYSTTLELTEEEAVDLVTRGQRLLDEVSAEAEARAAAGATGDRRRVRVYFNVLPLPAPGTDTPGADT